MLKTSEVIYGGKVFRPAVRLALEPNSRVRITIEIAPPAEGSAGSFRQVARSLNLDGPADWAANLDTCL